MAEKVKNEHYVPQRYLKHFANGENFFVFDKEKTEKRPGNVGDYACERYFYDVDFDTLKREKLEQDPDFKFNPEIEQIMQTIDVQHIEHWFGQNVETWLFDPIDKIISTYVMIKAYDKTSRIELLQMALELCKWLEKREKDNSIHIINRIQCEIRLRDIIDSEIDELTKLMDSNLNNQSQAAVHILMGNKRMADYYLKSLDEEEKKVFMEYPIYHLYENLK